LGFLPPWQKPHDKKGGGSATEYNLNRRQAIFITAKLEAPEATDITIQMIERFDAYEPGLAPGNALPQTERDGIVASVFNAVIST
jgi:phage regulator Rha-like protein